MRALARWGITPLLAAPLGAWALGLGDIELQSALNQPFRAEITLSATPEELQGLRVTLAGVDTFERYGIDRPEFLSTLEFRVAAGRDGRSLIQVTSRESIAEPFVTLLVEASWPRGRTLREYTVLLDPPVLLPAPAAPPAVRPAETRAPAANEPAGPISRPAPPPPAAPQPAPAPRVQPPPAGPVSSSPPPSPRVPDAEPGSTYGPVRRAETLWAIANRNRPAGVTINQMMIAVYQANPQAFGGNINLLRAGATLRLPETSDFDTLATTVANAEVQRQTDEWQARSTQRGQLRLLPPAETEVTRTPVPAPAPAPAPSPPAAAGGGAAATDDVAAAVEESRRLLEVRNAALQDLQQQAASEEPPAEEAPAAATEPGVDLEAEGEQVFTDETPEPAPAAEETPAPAPAQRPVVAEPSFVAQALGWVLSPFLWIGLGVAALLLTALWYMRRRREVAPEDVTGRWEALESEVADDEVREATARMRRQVPEETIVVEEQPPERRRAQAEPAETPRGSKAAPSVDDTLSSQGVINLDQADAVAEADFHMAYGLYDQAAELVQKALDAAPNRRDLKLKLLEVFFVWGNKDSFLKTAQGLREEIGHGGNADWDKVVIMGRQICPDERLFTEATTGSGAVDVDLQAGNSPLDLAFDEVAVGDDLGGGLDFNLEASGELPTPTSAARANVAAAHDLGENSLDIGERTAAHLEAALFTPDDEHESNETLRDLMGEHPVPQDPTARERAVGGRGSTGDATTMRFAAEGKPTSATYADAPTMATPTMETSYRLSSADQPGLAGTGSDFTAEIDLDDLGLDVKDFEGAPTDLGDSAMAVGQETDTREQPLLTPDNSLLSATGITQVLGDGDEDHEIEQRKTAVLADQGATVLAPIFDDGTLTGGTGVLEDRFNVNEQTGDPSLVNTIGEDGGLDLDLADLTAALHADTVEQPRATAFSRDVFAGGATPLDLDIGSEGIAVDEHAGTEELRSLDPQTMTEVGTKLDLARAYIDMGDPEGARSILEEVLDEGDPNQRREAQGLIDVLSA